MITGHAKLDSTSRILVKRHVMQDIAKARREDATFGKRNQLQFPTFLTVEESLGNSDGDNHSFTTGGEGFTCTAYNN